MSLQVSLYSYNHGRAALFRLQLCCSRHHHNHQQLSIARLSLYVCIAETLTRFID